MFPPHWCSSSWAWICIRHDLRTVEALSCQSTLCAARIVVLSGRSLFEVVPPQKIGAIRRAGSHPHGGTYS
eukprot:s3023_g6.t1